ncbi:MAG: polynucleotide adenylyltransferase PcnB [Candidatus Polarisedimenticolaceae bacterium]|nr:polynucleotide adenylyltransferase PcnB [Candidatus Polarisedimenticolaceae bacterium]
MSENAVKVLYRLKKAGYQAYLVGGGVRDLLLGREPKDFDVATDATPEDVKQVFRNCRLIGRRFRLAHVHFGREIIEVATFRGMHETTSDQAQQDSENGMLLRDNVYGTIEEDAMRRDFTINALYYNIGDFSVVDYADGLKDLQAGVLRLLGNPEQRYREDPVRMLRAVRFAAKLGFTINPACEKPLFESGDLLDGVPSARLFEEVLKLFLGGTALHAFEKLRHFDLFRHLFPETDESLSHEEQGFPITFVIRGLKNTDARVRADKPVTPAFLLAVFLWEPVRQRMQQLEAKGESRHDAMMEAGSEVIGRQVSRVSIPKRFTLQMREIWNMQHRLEQRGKRAIRLLEHPRFRAAYDFLLLRAESGETDLALAQWWTEIQEVSEERRIEMASATGAGGKKRRRRKPRKRPAAE